MKKGYEKRFTNGEIVYWCHYTHGKCYIFYGMVDTQFSDGVCICLLEPKDCRTVEGIPFDEWQPDYKKRKLPKNWSYDMDLFSYGYTSQWAENDLIFLNDFIKQLDITNPQNILEAYNKGYLVKSEENFHGEVDVDIGKGTWELRKKFHNRRYVLPRLPSMVNDYITVSSPKVYKTYEEALTEKQAYDKECERVMNLSELEWVIEEIDKKLDLWAGIYNISDKEKSAYRNWIMNLSDLESVEVRISQGQIQWKYLKHKRWSGIEISDSCLG